MERAAAMMLLAILAVGCERGDAETVAEDDPCVEVRETWKQMPEQRTDEGDRDYLRRVVERVTIIVEQNPACFTTDERATAEQMARNLERDQ